MSDRPLLAAVVPFLSPFRLHFLRRVVRELPEFRLATLVTQNPAENLWEYENLPEIGLEHFGKQTPWQHSAGVRKAWPADWRAGGRVCRRLEELGAVAVWQVGYAYPSHLRVLRWGRRRGVPVLLWGDSNIAGDRATGFKRLAKNTLMRRVVRTAAAITPCGKAGVAFFSRYGATPERTFLCPAEPDYSLILSPEAARVSSWRERLRLDPARVRLMCCARLVELKRYDAAIDAFAAIADERPNVDLLIVGDGPMREAWQARVPERLRTRVTWTGFVPDPADIAALYVHSHVLVHPGDYEAWGLVVLEAAAAGMALVCSTVVGAAADLLEDGVNGRFVPPGDARAVARALREITDPATLERMRAASRELSLRFRTEADPIRGLRSALAACGVRATPA